MPAHALAGVERINKDGTPCTLAECMAESEMVLYDCVENLLRKTAVQPQQVGHTTEAHQTDVSLRAHTPTCQYKHRTMSRGSLSCCRHALQLDKAMQPALPGH